MIERHITPRILQALDAFPVVGIIGPRQTGKTTLARKLESDLSKPTLFLDLERHSDRMRLQEPELFLRQHMDKCVIIDEVQNMPELLPLLRWLVDQHRVPARYILTGSSTPELLRDNTETLAGRIAYFELTPLTLTEVEAIVPMQLHWFRGGFPLSLLAESDEISLLWLENFVDTFLQRDIRSLGYDISVPSMGRLLQILASMNGKILRPETISNALDVSVKTVRKYLDILEGSFLIRRLSPHFTNTTKRLVRSPKLYFRDTGLLHSLLHIESSERLHGTLHLGPSWEGYVIEQVVAAARSRWQYDFYRTHAGAEADLILWRPGGKKILIEIKYSVDPSPSRGFYESAAELAPDYQYILIPEGDAWLRSDTQKVCGLQHFLREELPSLSEV